MSADAERLGQVVVGARIEADHLVAFLPPCGEHEDRRRGVRRLASDGATDRHAVEAGQDEIEDPEIESRLERQFECGVAVGGLHGLGVVDPQVQPRVPLAGASPA